MPQFPSTSSASGIWTLKKQKRAQQGSNWPPLVLPDPQFNYVTALLPGNGTNGAQNNTFLDSSTNNFTITRNGNTTQGTFTPYGSNWSNFFDGSSYFSSIGTTSSFNFMHQSSALWTCECFVFVTSLSAALYLIDNTDGTSGQTGVNIYIGTDGKINLFITSGSGGGVGVCTGVSSSGIQANTWNHIVVTYDQSLSSNNAKFYINGASVGTATKGPNTPSAGNASQTMRIGAVPGAPSNNFRGYISNLRITNSIVYSSAFTPPTTPLTAIANTALLTCQSNRFIDNSSNNFTITRSGSPSVQRFSPFAPTTPYAADVIGGSGYFDGGGDYLEVASNSAFTLGSSGDFTVEAWIYLSEAQGSSPYANVLTNWTNTSTYTNRWSFAIASTTLYWFNSNGSGVINTTVGIGEWVHIAAVRSGSTITVYKNGVSVGTQTTNQDYSLDGPLRIGNLPTYNAFKGYIAGARIVKGTAVYTSAFTPPTAPLTAITNTSFLCSFTNGGIIDNAMMGDLETRGTAQISTAQSKFGGGSLAFDGTSGNMVTGPSVIMPQYDLPGDFTIEAWMYINSFASLATSPTIVNKLQGNIGEQSYRFAMRSNEFVFTYSLDGINVTQITKSITNNTGTWYHVALTRSGNNLRFFRDGVQVGTTETISGSIFSNGPQPFSVGSWNSGASGITNGYIDDFRLTKGYARYTANFTPPAAPFPPL